MKFLIHWDETFHSKSHRYAGFMRNVTVAIVCPAWTLLLLCLFVRKQSWKYQRLKSAKLSATAPKECYWKYPKLSSRTKSLLGLKKSDLLKMQWYLKKENNNIGNTATFVKMDLFCRVSVCVWCREIWPSWQLLLRLTIYNTSVHTHTQDIHAQTGKTKSSTGSHTNIQVVNKSSFFLLLFIKERSIKLHRHSAFYGVTTALEKATITQT